MPTVPGVFTRVRTEVLPWPLLLHSPFLPLLTLYTHFKLIDVL